MAPNDFRGILQTVDQPVEIIVICMLNLLEAIRFVERPIAVYKRRLERMVR